MIVVKETLDQLLVEIDPSEIWNEVDSAAKVADVDLNLDVYRNLELVDALAIFIARGDDDTFMGYVAYIIQNRPHSKNLKQASVDSIYVLPEFRTQGVAAELLTNAEAYLSTMMGAQIMSIALKDKRQSFHNTLAELGYELVELVYSKKV